VEGERGDWIDRGGQGGGKERIHKGIIYPWKKLERVLIGGNLALGQGEGGKCMC